MKRTWRAKRTHHSRSDAGKIDPVRFITNHSTGKMGRAIAENCMLRGAHVTLVNASVSVEPPMFVDVVNVTSAADMADVVKSKAAEQDIIIMTAAVADFAHHIRLMRK